MASMSGLLRLQAVTVVLLLLGTSVVRADPGRGRDNEQELLARIQRERNPVKKAKFGIQLGELELQQAISAYDSGNINQGQQLLAAYIKVMTDCWEALRTSGRHAVKQPQGFKELDIALREGRRMLEDLKHRVLYSNRAPVDKAAQEADQIRNQVLKALFPSENLKDTNRSTHRHRSNLGREGRVR